MRTYLLRIFALTLAAASTCWAETADKFSPLNLTPGYRPTFSITDKAIYNGFQKIDERKNISTVDVSARPTGPNLTSVLSRFGELGLSGVIPSAVGTEGKVSRKGVIILGGQVYREGDEITLYDGKTKRTSPLVTDHKVVIHSITLQAIGLDVSLIELKQIEQLRVELDEFHQR